MTHSMHRNKAVVTIAVDDVSMVNEQNVKWRCL